MFAWFRRSALLIGGVALLAGIAACGSDDTPDPAAARRAQAALDTGAELKRQVLAVENTLVDRCLTAQGLPLYDLDGAAVPSSRQNFESPPVETARLLGYGLDPRRRPPESEKPPRSAWERLPDAERLRYTRARFGDMDSDVVSYDFGHGQISSPLGGCVGRTRLAIYGDLHEFLRLDWLVTNQLKEARAQAVRDDEGLSQALSSWSACMRDKGRPGLADPAAARRNAEEIYADVDPADRAGLDRALAREIEAALADATCADTTRLREVSQQVRAQAMAEQLAAHEADIVAWREFMSKALGRAQQLLALG
ncbi:hypothetical protein [Catellatospora sp. TT07R-123]|uniref:hypothetical protein n=1 Tax=Catellatospora sp. TT07R-123 TaxID=2733863 RepID=UPI001BB30CF7|nr:hypothetical protein [Catellatospora sp. TT07R-123]